MGPADQLPLRSGGRLASSHEAADVAPVLDLCEDRFDDLLAFPVKGATGLVRDLTVRLLHERRVLPEPPAPVGCRGGVLFMLRVATYTSGS